MQDFEPVQRQLDQERRQEEEQSQAAIRELQEEEEREEQCRRHQAQSSSHGPAMGGARIGRAQVPASIEPSQSHGTPAEGSISGGQRRDVGDLGQLKIWKEIQKKIEQERNDAELARKIQENLSRPGASTATEAEEIDAATAKLIEEIKETERKEEQKRKEQEANDAMLAKVWDEENRGKKSTSKRARKAPRKSLEDHPNTVPMD
mmetsp:Transcript_48083/g.75093  ORF Transcript_48083/g.75093 Transcript_48083/m.75093 type:complete len:205 (+) Transcript_48083:977-1591(+)